jgi:hypothetical protein
MSRRRTIGRASHGEVEGRQIVPEFIDLTGEKVHEPSRALLTLKEVFLGDALWHQRESVHLDTSKMNTESRVLLSFSWYGTEHSVFILKGGDEGVVASAVGSLHLHLSSVPTPSTSLPRHRVGPLRLGSAPITFTSHAVDDTSTTHRPPLPWIKGTVVPLSTTWYAETRIGSCQCRGALAGRHCPA